MHTPPGPTGLYDPRFEHDSCGVSFVANIKGVASHELVLTGLRRADQPRAPRRHGRRAGHGRRRRDPRPGPRPLPARRVPRVDFDLPPRRGVRRRHGLPARRQRRRREGAGHDRDDRRRRGARPSSGGATSPSTRLPRRHRPGGDAARSVSWWSATRAEPPGSTSTARRSSPASAPSTSSTPSWRRTSRRCRRARSSTRGCSRRRSCRRSSRPPRRALRERPAARAQPLLHQHVPVVAAGPPVPLHRPQRRDQHRPGQPELDARPRGDARHGGRSPGSTGRSRSAPRARPTRPASTRCSSCCTSAGGRCTTPC